VGVDARNAGRGKQLGQVFLDTLRASPHGLQVLVAAIGTGMRYTRLKTTMVALQVVAPGAGPMQYGIRRATRALADPAAGSAVEHRCVAASIQEDQRLLAGFEPLAHGRDQLR